MYTKNPFHMFQNISCVHALALAGWGVRGMTNRSRGKDFIPKCANSFPFSFPLLHTDRQMWTSQ